MKQFKVTMRRIIEYPPQLVNAVDEMEARRAASYYGLTARSDTAVIAGIEEVDTRKAQFMELAKELGIEQVADALTQEFNAKKLITEIEDWVGLSDGWRDQHDD